MQSRYILIACIFAISMAVAYSAVVPSENSDESEINFLEFDETLDEIETRDFWSKLRDKALKIIKNHFKDATEECLKEAANKCKKLWYNPAKVIKCAVSKQTHTV
uniref:Uncharacterized protein n=1 Tax=Trichogramma kaykai TaxID=54128 RepID=A0ABD2VTJ2_9HYME